MKKFLLSGLCVVMLAGSMNNASAMDSTDLSGPKAVCICGAVATCVIAGVYSLGYYAKKYIDYRIAKSVLKHIKRELDSVEYYNDRYYGIFEEPAVLAMIMDGQDIEVLAREIEDFFGVYGRSALRAVKVLGNLFSELAYCQKRLRTVFSIATDCQRKEIEYLLKEINTIMKKVAAISQEIKAGDTYKKEQEEKESKERQAIDDRIREKKAKALGDADVKICVHCDCEKCDCQKEQE